MDSLESVSMPAFLPFGLKPYRNGTKPTDEQRTIPRRSVAINVEKKTVTVHGGHGFERSLEALLSCALDQVIRCFRE